ncbi:endonuclease domain-containing protein [Brevundimonas sp.]|uniref:endonuclease domain-containing protein n=1 Tax=Brevundimonas sp. TaxID=1871086 RepID=UPI0035670482
MTPETRTARARDPRKRRTHAENILWQALRASRLDGFRFRRQHPIDRYFADFACESIKLVIELDGGVHDDDDRQLNDYHRQQAIESLGWSVLRFPNTEVTGSLPTVLAAIRAQAKLAGAVTPHPPVGSADGPLPLPMGEGTPKPLGSKLRLPRYRP